MNKTTAHPLRSPKQRTCRDIIANLNHAQRGRMLEAVLDKSYSTSEGEMEVIAMLGNYPWCTYCKGYHHKDAGKDREFGCKDPKWRGVWTCLEFRSQIADTLPAAELSRLVCASEKIAELRAKIAELM